MTGTHAGRHDQHIVARSDATVRPAKTHKRRALLDGNVVGRGVERSSGISRMTGTSLDMFSWRDLITFVDAQRSSDWLAILQNEFAGRNVAYGEAVARRNGSS